VGSPGVLPQSDTEAYLWARKAAEQGLAKAQYAIGYFTEVRTFISPAEVSPDEVFAGWHWFTAIAARVSVMHHLCRYLQSLTSYRPQSYSMVQEGCRGW